MEEEKVEGSTGIPTRHSTMSDIDCEIFKIEPVKVASRFDSNKVINKTKKITPKKISKTPKIKKSKSKLETKRGSGASPKGNR